MSVDVLRDSNDVLLHAWHIAANEQAPVLAKIGRKDCEFVGGPAECSHDILVVLAQRRRRNPLDQRRQKDSVREAGGLCIAPQTFDNRMGYPHSDLRQAAVVIPGRLVASRIAMRDVEHPRYSLA